MFTREHPFLTRELRQLARRPRAVQWAMVLCLAAMGCTLLIWSQQKATFLGPYNYDFMLGAMVVFHWGLCVIAASYGGYRTFVAEHLRGTLESTLLLPYTPAQWVLEKLLFPFLCLLIATGIGFPFYLLAAVCNLMPVSDIFPSMGKALFGGSLVLADFFLWTPDYLKRAQQMKINRINVRRKFDLNSTLHGTLAAIYSFPAQELLLFTSPFVSTPRQVYGVSIAQPWLLVAALGSFFVAVYLTAVSATLSDQTLERRAIVARGLAVGIAYYLILGLAWNQYPANWRWIGFFVPALSIGFSMLVSRPREESQSANEVLRMAALWDNPLFIKDLRVYGRQNSILGQFKFNLAITLLAIVALMAAVSRIGLGFMNALGPASFQMIFFVSVIPWSAAKMFWAKEWSSQTLTLLLLTPLSSREILLGRFLAVPARQLPSGSPYAIFPLAVVVWATCQGYWIVGPLVLAILPLLFSVGIWSCCNVVGAGGLSASNLVGDFNTNMLRFIQMLLLAACAWLGVAGFSSGIFAPIGWLCALLLCAGNAALAWFWFASKVTLLEEYRHGDIELPMSKVMQQQA